MKKSEKKLRVPRPMGSTQLVNSYNLLPEEDKSSMREKIVMFFIHQWFLSNGNLSGVNYSINDISLFLKVEPVVIQTYMRDQVLNSKLWDKDIQQNLMEALLGQQLAWTFEDRMEIQNQLEILKKSQNGRYMPFISSEMNKALKLKLESTTSLQALVRSLSGSANGGSINIFNQFNQQNNNQETGVTTAEALLIIQEEQNKLPVSEKNNPQLFIESKYDLSDLPEVCALNQEGVNTDKEGLNLNKTELNKITDDYHKSIELSSIEFKELDEEINHHTLRRQIDYGEDIDSDDPELKIYDR